MTEQQGATQSAIRNEPGNLDPRVVKIREQLEHRALWMALLIDEAEKRGLSDEFAQAAIRRCGHIHGEGHVKRSGTTSLKGLEQTVFTEGARPIFEMDVKHVDDDELDVDFHYCPLVSAWQKLGLSDERIARLCDLAMEGDRGIAERHGCELELRQTIANGDDVCEICFVRR